MISSSELWSLLAVPLAYLRCDLMMLRPRSCWTLKLSVTTRCPFMKTPNEPESTVAAAGGLALSLSLSLAVSCFWAGAWAAKAHPSTIATSHRTVLHCDALFLGNSSTSLSPAQIAGSGALPAHPAPPLATRFHPHRRSHFTPPATLAQPP